MNEGVRVTTFNAILGLIIKERKRLNLKDKGIPIEKYEALRKAVVGMLQEETGNKERR